MHRTPALDEADAAELRPARGSLQTHDAGLPDQRLATADLSSATARGYIPPARRIPRQRPQSAPVLLSEASSAHKTLRRAMHKESARGLRQRGSDYRCCIPALAGFVSPQSIAPDGAESSREAGRRAIGFSARRNAFTVARVADSGRSQPAPTGRGRPTPVTGRGMLTLA